jgi:RNA polymerase sigma factor (sigma-70 family)
MKNLFDKYLDSTGSNFILAKPQAHDIEIALWNSFRSGNREALNTIFEKNARVLYSYGMNLTSDGDLIADCIQDIFVELWVKREIVAPQVNSIKHYLIKSVRRRILRRLSEEKRLAGRALPDNYHEAVEFHIEFNLIQDQTLREISLQLQSSVATLSNGQQEAIYLKFYENMTYEEVASVMKTNVKAVYNLVGKSIISLRKYFKAHPLVRQ